MFETASESINNGNGNNNNYEVISNHNYKLKFPFSIKPVDTQLNEQLLKDFTGSLRVISNLYDFCYERVQ